MSPFPSPDLLRKAMSLLLIPTVLLPVGMALLFAFARFFTMAGDSVSASVLDWTALGVGVFWVVDLVALLLCAVFALLQQGP